MKKIFILLVLTLAAASTAHSAGSLSINGAAPSQTKRIKGSGKLITRTLPVPAFDAVHASRTVNVNLVAGGDKIVIEADDNLADYVIVSSDGNTLHARIDPRIQQIQSPHITITVPTDGKLKLLKASSSGDILAEVPITGADVLLDASSSGEITAAVNAEKCRIEASSSAEIKAGVNASACTVKASSSAEITAALMTRSCEVRCSSSAEITLSGRADSCTAECSSSADYTASKFVVKRYDIRVSSSADAEICCTEHLVAHASSSGSVDYTGNCTVEKHTSSAGSISKD